MSPASQSFRFRESRRLLRDLGVRLSAPGEDGELDARTRDVAIGGMFVATPEPRPVGTAMHFALEVGPADAPEEISGEATVVWVRTEAGGPDQPAGMGMQFSRVEPPGEERLAMLFSERPAEAAVAAPAAGTEAPPSSPVDSETADAEVAAAPDGAEGAPEPEPDPASESEAVELAPAAPEEAEDPLEEAEDPLEAAGANEDETFEAASDDDGDAFEDDAADEPVEVDEAVAAAPEPAVDPSLADLPPISPQPTDALSIDAPLAQAAGDDDLGGTRADLFSGLADDDQEWMKPESASRPWLWPAVGAVVLLVALFLLRAPLLRLVGLGGTPAPVEEQAAAQSFEISSSPAGAGPAPEGVEEPSGAGRLLVPIDEQSGEAAVTTAPVAAQPTAAESAPPATTTSGTAAATPPANATAIRSIIASMEAGRTVVEIVGNAPFQRHHVMSLQDPPRLVIRLIGVQRDYNTSAVKAARLRGIRTGVHGRGATRNLHVVFDLAAPNIAATIERRGNRIVVNLSD